MGGGGTILTELGESLLKEYTRAERYVSEILGDETYWEVVGLRISARNRLEGTVQQVDKGIITAKVRIKIDKPVVVTAIISKEVVQASVMFIAPPITAAYASPSGPNFLRFSKVA